MDDRIARIIQHNKLNEEYWQLAEENRRKTEKIERMEKDINEKEALLAQRLDEIKFLEEEVKQMREKAVALEKSYEDQIFSLKRELRRERRQNSNPR